MNSRANFEILKANLHAKISAITSMIVWLTIITSSPRANALPPDGGAPPVCIEKFAHLIRSGKRVPPVLQRHVNTDLEGKILDPRMLSKSVRLASLDSLTGSELANLTDQFYVYVIDTKGRIAWMPRTIDPGASVMKNSDAKFLGSHEGLLTYLRSLDSSSSPQTNLVASGEILSRYNRIYAVSNGSGTYRGGPEHLAYGIENLKRAGLKIDGRTLEREYSTGNIPDPHALAPISGRVEIAWKNDPNHAILWRDARNVMNVVDSKFTPENPLARVAMSSFKTPEGRKAIFDGIQFSAMWQHPGDSEATTLQRFIDAYGEARTRAALNALAEVAARN